MAAIGMFMNGIRVKNIEFPVTKPGNISEVKIELRNDVANYVKIKEVILHDETVKVKQVPDGLEPDSKKELILEWTPVKDTLTPLRTNIDFEVVIG